MSRFCLLVFLCLCVSILTPIHWVNTLHWTSHWIGAANAQAEEPIQPIPSSVDYDPAKASFGKQLFFDKRLSVDDTISCASCHDISAWGAEARQVSEGIERRLGDRNSPTVFNSALNFKQFWDGRADNLSHQAAGPVTNPVEMGMASWDNVIEKLNNNANYVSKSNSLYGQELSKQVVTDAIAEYEKTLLTPNSPFDQYLRGDRNAISAEQTRGYELFKSYGCISCHQGTNVGGNMFQKFGVLHDISMNNSSLSKDLGRYNVTKNEWDKRVFKVPSLRLATKTAPYFHDGSVATIQEAVDIMIRFQLGRNVPANDRDAIIMFLESLVGEKLEGIE